MRTRQNQPGVRRRLAIPLEPRSREETAPGVAATPGSGLKAAATEAIDLLRAHTDAPYGSAGYQWIAACGATQCVCYGDVIHFQRAPHRLVEIDQRFLQIRLRAQSRALCRRQIA